MVTLLNNKLLKRQDQQQTSKEDKQGNRIKRKNPLPKDSPSSAEG
ncbi:MAG: hypothetical protein RR304_07990 [Bacteroides sp.]